MFGFEKTKPAKVAVGPQLAEVLDMQVKVRTPVGEFLLSGDFGEPAVLLPGDSVTVTWTWRGFKSEEMQQTT